MRLVTDVFAYCTSRAAGLELHQRQRLPHARGRRDGRPGAGVHAGERHRVLRRTPSAPGWRSTSSRRGWPSSSTATTSCSRRSPSSGRRGGCGRRSRASGSGRTNPRSWMLRFHTQTAGVSLQAQQIETNVVRVTVQALAAVLGGTQSLHTNARDEALALPTEESAKLALRTQQVLAYESGVADVVDPLAGSYYVESLTEQVEAAAWRYIEQIDALGGALRGHRAGLHPGRDPGERLPLPAGDGAWRPGDRRGEPLHGRRAVGDAGHPAGGPVRSDRQVERIRAVKASSRRGRGAGGARGPGGCRAWHREHDAAHPGLRRGALHARRDLGHVASGLRRGARACGALIGGQSVDPRQGCGGRIIDLVACPRSSKDRAAAF